MKKKYLSLIGLIIFIILLIRTDLKLLLTTLLKANIWLLIVVLFLIPLIIFIQALKWKYLAISSGIKVSVHNSFIFTCKGLSLGFITPGRIGDLYKAKYLQKKSKSSIGNSLVSIIIDKIIDLFTILILGIVSILILSSLFNIYISTIKIIMMLITIFIITYIFLKKKYIKIFLKPLYLLMIPKKLRKIVKINFNDFYNTVGKLKVKNYLIGSSYSLLMWFTSIFACYLLSISLDKSIPLWFISAAIPLVSLISTIPISISGIGTRDITLVFLFSLIDKSSEIAIALSILMLIFRNFLPALIGLVLFLKEK